VNKTPLLPSAREAVAISRHRTDRLRFLPRNCLREILHISSVVPIGPRLMTQKILRRIVCCCSHVFDVNALKSLVRGQWQMQARLVQKIAIAIFCFASLAFRPLPLIAQTNECASNSDLSPCRQISLSSYQITEKTDFSVVVYSSDLTTDDVVVLSDGTVLQITDRQSDSFRISGRSNSAAGQKITVTLERQGRNQSLPVSIEVISPPEPSAVNVTGTMGSVPQPQSTPAAPVASPSRVAAASQPAPQPAAASPTPSGRPAAQSKAIRAVPKVAATPNTALAAAPVAPVISSITPTVPGNTVSTIGINGTGFDATTEVFAGSNPLTVTSASSTQLTATGYIPLTIGNTWAIRVLNPASSQYSNVVPLQIVGPSTTPSYAEARRFLQQATWGPTPASIRHLQDVGIDTWLNEQFDSMRTPVSQYNAPEDLTASPTGLQEQFFGMAVSGADQLRQRVAFALSQIAVVSDNKLDTYESLMGYQQMLLSDAFGKYSDFLKDVTLSPAMGHYLDMVNNDVPSVVDSPNENFAREVMQLMSIGLVQLNPDGSVANGSPANYTEDDIHALARVFTGWTYPSCGAPSKWTNPPCYGGPMVFFEQHHDQTAKSVLGVTIQTGTAAGDLNLALNTIERVSSSDPTIPNMAPFVSLRLIQHLVTSNPDPAYVARVAQVFAATQGDLKEVVRSIVEDPAAGFGNGGLDLPGADGHLEEPVLYAVQMLRALNAQIDYDPGIQTATAQMGQDLFDPPSVFNYYSPSYRLPNTNTVAPEFQIFTQYTALQRMNYVYNLVRNAIHSNIYVDLSNWAELGSDNDPATRVASITVMLNAVSQARLGQPMSSDMVNAIMPAMLATWNPTLRAQTAVLLVSTSGQYQVQR
jgi:uncharacterized protein (DUF1800 family)